MVSNVTINFMVTMAALGIKVTDVLVVPLLSWLPRLQVLLVAVCTQTCQMCCVHISCLLIILESWLNIPQNIVVCTY
jgi:hypothetical protein